MDILIRHVNNRYLYSTSKHHERSPINLRKLNFLYAGLIINFLKPPSNGNTTRAMLTCIKKSTTGVLLILINEYDAIVV